MIIFEKTLMRFVSNLSYEIQSSLMKCCKGVQSINGIVVATYYKRYPEELQKDIDSVRNALIKALKEKYKDSGPDGNITNFS